MKTLRLTEAIPAMLLACLFFASCEKKNPETPQNPTEEKIPRTSFDLSITEVRQTKTFTWAVDEKGGTDNGEESIKDLYVTQYNEVTLKADADVNVKSDHPELVNVTRVDNRTYTLTYKGEGTVVITAWNGEESLKYEKSFKVKAQECVDITGIKFSWYDYHRETRSCTDKVVSINHFKTRYINLGHDGLYRGANGDYCDIEPESDFILDSDYYDWDNIYVFGPNENGVTVRLGGKPYGHEMVFLGFEPENTSFREILAFESDYMLIGNYKNMVKNGEVKDGEYLWCNEKKLNKDVAEMIGTHAYFGHYGRYFRKPFYMAEITIQADTKRYYYLYHGMNSDPEPTYEDRHGH